MELTGFGYVLLPLCVAAILQPAWQLRLVILTGVFGAATPLVLGGLGLPPGVIPACLFLLYVALQFLLGARFPGAPRAWRTVEPFVLAAVYALLTAVMVPRLFAGAFTVWPQKLTPPYDIPIPLAPGGGNVTQSLYLLIDGALLVCCALYLARPTTNFVRLLGAYLLSGYVVVGLCLWQFVHKLTGLWYPEVFLYSNPGWAIAPGQTVGFVPRINGPFSEPSALAYYLSGTMFCCAWLLLRGFRSRMAIYLLPMAVLALLASTSTTGFTVLSIGSVGLFAYGLTRAPRRVASRIFTYALPLAVIAIVGGIALSTLSARVEQALSLVAQMSLVKTEGESFATRTRWDLDSLAVIVPTYGLGAGWGSVRASSLVPGLLANLGVFGCALLGWFVVRVVRQVGRARRLAREAAPLMALEGFAAALIGQTTAALVSVPAIAGLDFYVLLGALIACAARLEDGGARWHAEQRLVVARAAPPSP